MPLNIMQLTPIQTALALAAGIIALYIAVRTTRRPLKFVFGLVAGLIALGAVVRFFL